MGFPYSQISTLLSAQSSLCLLSFCCFAPAALKTAEQETLLHCSTLCLCFLSPLLSISWITSSSASSLYSDKHNTAPSSPFSLPAMQFVWHLALCINICLHQWLYCRQRQRGRKSYATIGTCAIVFSSEETWGNMVAHLPVWLHPFLLLMRLFSLTTHHSVLLPDSSVTGRSLYCHRAFFLLYPSVYSISQIRAAYVPRSPAPPSSCFCSVSLHVSARPDLLFLLSGT